MIGTTEIIIIIGAAVFLFGGKKVVDWARSMGQAKKVFEEESQAIKSIRTESKSESKLNKGDINAQKA